MEHTKPIFIAAVDCAFNRCGYVTAKANSTKSSSDIEITSAGVIDTTKVTKECKQKSLHQIERAVYLVQELGYAIVDPTLFFATTQSTTNSSTYFIAEAQAGAQSAAAANCLGIAKGVLSSVIRSLNYDVTCLVTTPQQLHKKVTGTVKASKDQIMDYVSHKFKIPSVKGKYTLLGKKYGKGEFEHIADSICLVELALDHINKKIALKEIT